MEKINPPLCSSFPLPLYWRARAPVGSEPVLRRRPRLGLGVPFFFFFFWRAEIRTHPSQDGGEKQES